MDQDGLFRLRPFGETSCEQEVKLLGAQYASYYFTEAPFNAQAVDKNTYLIVGRRGSGKTSLIKYFQFQDVYPNAINIDVEEPAIFSNVLNELTEADGQPELTIPRMARTWEYLLWFLILNRLRDQDSLIQLACVSIPNDKHPAKIIKHACHELLQKTRRDPPRRLLREIDSFFSSARFLQARDIVLKLTSKLPVIVSIDSLEQYAIDNIPMMRATAALVQSASNWNIEYASNGLQVKVFLPSEVFPHICENEVLNTSKYVRDPLHLLWRPKDLVRLTAWRFFKYLSQHNQLRPQSRDAIDWTRYADVRKKMWLPYFGDKITNRMGLQEDPFPYLLRHTQMRPRQLIILCNEIAKQAQSERTFPEFSERAILQGTRIAELQLAREVINSHKSVYPGVGSIVNALSRKPMMFEARLLDKIAPETAGEWPRGDYSRVRFRQLLADVGVLGVVRKYDKTTRTVEADFQYAMEDRLYIPTGETCVVHPMFFERLQTSLDQTVNIYPFPDHPDFSEVVDRRRL